jgi:hypothetical protein
MTAPPADAGSEGRYLGPGDLVPRPDPTVLTTQLVDRSLAAYREVVDERLASMDRAVEVLHADTARIAAAHETNRELLRADVSRQLDALRDLVMAEIRRVADVGQERFAAVAMQFSERDERTKQADIERQKSLDAALAAQKEAVREQNTANDRAIAKSDQTTQKQIDQQATLTTNIGQSLDEKIRRVESRLDRIEAGALTAGESKVEYRAQAGEQRATAGEQRLNLGAILGALAVMISLAMLITFVVTSK